MLCFGGGGGGGGGHSLVEENRYEMTDDCIPKITFYSIQC